MIAGCHLQACRRAKRGGKLLTMLAEQFTFSKLNCSKSQVCLNLIFIEIIKTEKTGMKDGNTYPFAAGTGCFA
jgi:hypothetical protein